MPRVLAAGDFTYCKNASPMNGLKVQRNDPCTCNSGRKFKLCCGSAERIVPSAAPTPALLLERALAKHQAGTLDVAAALYVQILQQVPDHADALHLLGLIDYQKGDKLAAVAHIEAAIRISRADARYFYNLGTVLMALSKPHEAAVQFRIAIEMDPKNAQAHGNLGAALRDMAERDAAIASFRTAIALVPTDVDAWSNLSATLNENDQKEEALVCLDRALALNPQQSSSLNNLGFALQGLGDTAQAIACFARAAEIDPNNAKAYFNLGCALQVNPLPDEPETAIACYRHGLALNPDHPHTHDNLLMGLQYAVNTTPAEIFAQHLQFARQFEAPLKNSWQPHANTRDPHRRLKIGYVSADLYNHAVASFIEPILAHHDPRQVEVYCYYNGIKHDSITDRLRALVPNWITCTTLSEDQLATRIRADGIDILIDLSGHTGGNRLLTFARKPAPVQASWIGYPGTSGLEAMDYYLADRFYLPAGLMDDQFTEKIVRMPAAGGFQPYTGAPHVNRLPALADGAITFGSFNQLHKFSEAVIALWSALLRALPMSTMLLGGLPPGEKRDGLIRFFAAQGIPASRLRFHDRCPLDVYMALHHQVDICLDTFPYSGGTTTLHAAWMGVPTLTLAGKNAAGRQGGVLQGHTGLEAFVATDTDDFIRRGVWWAQHLDELADIRAGLRTRFQTCALGQPTIVTAGLEKALRQMWQRWCACLLPESFDVTL